MSGPVLRLGVFQFAPALLELDANAGRIAGAALESGADLLLTPELSLTGYDLADDAAAVALPVTTDLRQRLRPLADAADTVVGLVESTPDGRLFNTAVHVRGGEPLASHRKVYLPTYGMFDELRFFGRGRGVRTYEPAPGWRVGLLICEDFWHPGLAYLLAAAGATLILVQAAAPGRGVLEATSPGPRFASAESWERIVRVTAQLYGVYVALANRVGVEGALTFAGGSLIVGPTGDVLARAPDDAEALLTVELSPDELVRARRPYAHARDEDLELMRRELDRIVRGGTP